jgi:hypothetical protein
VNYVLQRALAPGVLVGAPRPAAQQRGTMGMESDGEEEEEEEEEETGGAAPARRVVGPRAPRPASRPAAFQSGARTLTERRAATYESVKGHYQ